MHNSSIALSVLVSLMQLCICHAQASQMKNAYTFCAVWVIAAAEKVFYFKLGDGSDL